MLSITLDSAGKKYGREWIFRKLTHELAPGSKTVILGGNGSGKSTLLQVIAGYITPNEGKVVYSANGSDIDHNEVYHKVSFASPYLQLVEDFTGLEVAEHVSKFKKFRRALTPAQVLELCYLEQSADKPVKQYSSGMKQRLKLALALLADTPVVLLDEPTSNLDKQAIAWYQQMISYHSAGRTLVVCSNAVEEEYFFCDKQVRMEEYKTPK